MPNNSLKESKYRKQRRSLISRIHIAKTQLGLADDIYRTLLMDVTGRNSCSLMDNNQLIKVLGRMYDVGFKGASPKKRLATKDIVTNALAPAQKQRAKINALLSDNKLPLSYGNAIAKKMFGADSFIFCNATQCRAIITALVKKYGDK